MKKIISIISAMLLITSLIATTAGAYVRPGDEGVITVSPEIDCITIDGSIDQDEWQTNATTLDENNLVTWTAPGEFTGPIDCWFAWGDEGLYIAASITDAEIEEGPSTIFQIALNPGGIINTTYPGLFFSIGRSQDSNNLTLRKHNWQSSADQGTDVEANGKYMILKDGQEVTGWSLEIIIPWSLIASSDRTQDIANGVTSLAGFDPAEEDAFCDATIAYVKNVAGVVSTGRTTTDGFVSWNVDSYDIVLMFEQPTGGETEEETEADTSADGESTDDEEVIEDTLIDTEEEIGTEEVDEGTGTGAAGDTDDTFGTQVPAGEETDNSEDTVSESINNDSEGTDAETEETKTSDNPDNPKTSDAALIAIASVAAVACAGFIVSKKISKK